MVTTFTYSPSLVRIDARNFENPPTHTYTHTHTQTGPITIHCAAASAQCNKHSRIGLHPKRMALAYTEQLGRSS